MVPILIRSYNISLSRTAECNTLAKYFAGFSAHLRIVKSANAKFPDVSLLITYHIYKDHSVMHSKRTENVYVRRVLNRNVTFSNFRSYI